MSLCTLLYHLLMVCFARRVQSYRFSANSRDDWRYERGSNVYFLGNAIHLQASVTLSNHLPLLLYIDWCVATPTFNFDADAIKYSIVDYHGCLSDSRSSYSRSKFLQRSEGNKLNLLLDAFRFHNLASNMVYITCYLKAIPAVYSESTQNRACSFIDGRWQSVDGNDGVCNSCEPSRQGAAEPEQSKHFRITQAPPVMQPKVGHKSGPADFVEVIPGQSLEPYRALMKSRQNAYVGPTKRGTDTNEDWELATLGPLLLIPKEETTTQSVARPAEVFSASVNEEPEFLFNLTQMSPVTDELEFETAPETRSFRPFEDSLFLDASDLFSSEEGSGFEK
ncbi:hypothetical protein PO909_030530 [Leuciscus waleckii]